MLWTGNYPEQYDGTGVDSLPPGDYYWHISATGYYVGALSPTNKLTVVAPKTIVLNPTGLKWTAVAGGSNPPAQSITFSATGAGGMGFQTHSEQLASWVTQGQLVGNTISYSVNVAGLKPGTYTSTMAVDMWYSGHTSLSVSGSPYTVPMTLVVLPGPAVRDPSFDTWNDGWLGLGRGFTHWDEYSTYLIDLGSEFHSTVAHSGAFAAGITNNSSSPSQVVGLKQSVSVVPGYAYTLRAYSMTDRNPGSSQLRIAFTDAAGNALVSVSTAGDQWGLGASAWTRLGVIGVAPPGAAQAEIHLRLTGGSYMGPGGGFSGGRVLWDDVTWDRSAGQVTSGPGAVPATHSRLTVSPSRPRRGKSTAFTSVLTPGAAASGTSSKLLLYRQETKTVKKRVRGKMRKVKVKYWRLRSTVPMTPGAVGASTTFTAKCKVKYAGKWQAVASFSGGGGYAATTSTTKAFSVR
jgi:hypothetical protein